MSVIDRTVDQLAELNLQLSRASTLEEVSPLYLKKMRVVRRIREMEDELNTLSRGWSLSLLPKRNPLPMKRRPVTA